MLLHDRTAERSKLVQSRQEALAELKHLRQEMMSEVDFDVDEADEQITEHETASILIALLEHKIQDIDSALWAIDSGDYESCARCGQVIEPKRLAAKPDTRLCIACQEVVEHSQV
jgi:DnaK suppressor protein